MGNIGSDIPVLLLLFVIAAPFTQPLIEDSRIVCTVAHVLKASMSEAAQQAGDIR